LDLSEAGALLDAFEKRPRKFLGKTVLWKTKRKISRRILTTHQKGIHIIGISFGNQVYIRTTSFLDK